MKNTFFILLSIMTIAIPLNGKQPQTESFAHNNPLSTLIVESYLKYRMISIASLKYMSIRNNIFDDSAYHTFETDINKPDENDQSLEYDQEKTTYHSAIDLIEKSTLPALAPGVYLKIDRYTKCKKPLYGNGYSCQTAVPKKFFIMNDDEQNTDSTWIDGMIDSI